MRNTFFKIAAALAVVTVSAAPAMACGGGLFTVCGQSYGGSYNAGYGYAGVGAYERLPDPTPVTRQYYYANQGPTFSGPGMFAPEPTYQETAIGWRGYNRGYGYGYGARRGYYGGPYANPVNYSEAPAYRAPAVYRYQPRVQYRARPSYRYGYSMRPRVRYGYAPRSYGARSYGVRSYGSHSHVSRGYVQHTGYRQAQRFAAPRVMYAPRAAAPQRGYQQPQQRPRHMR